jgi:hypothetical protein
MKTLYMVRYESSFIRYFRQKDAAIIELRNFHTAIYWVEVSITGAQYEILVKNDEII